MVYQIKVLIYSIFNKLFLLSWSNKWSTFVVEKLGTLTKSVQIENRRTFFSTTNTLLLYRVDTLYSKEPETIEWLDSMKESDILYDVGANVGMFSIYAGMRGVQVLAFEPVYYNYNILNQNIITNNLCSKVTAYPLALADKMSFGEMQISSTLPGAAFNTFDIHLSQSKHVQGSVSFRMDSLVNDHHLPSPTHIKIDVDGIELLIVTGMSGILVSEQLKSILIEIDEDKDQDLEIRNIIESAGFKMSKKGSKFEGSNMRNYIWSKD